MKNKKRIITIAFIFAAASLHFPLLSSQKVLASSYTEGKAECVMEQNSRRILYEKRGEARLPMASTTKIATAVTVLELCENIQEQIEIPKGAEEVEGSSIYLKSGDIYTVEELLYGLMLRSGNDSAVALALHTKKDISSFALEMNKIAQKAGALQTNFCNPHGLHDTMHYTTARDLSFITCYAMQNPTFRKIVGAEYYAPRHWKNKNKLLQLYKGGIGVKTGYTKNAGRCLVSAAEHDGMTLICSLLNCPKTYERTMELFDDAFAHYHYQTILSENETFDVTKGDKTIKGVVKENFSYPLLEEERSLIKKEIMVQDFGLTKDNRGEIIGQIKISLAKHLLFSGNLYKL